MEKIEYFPEIKQYVESRIGNQKDAEDLTQQVFLEFYQKKSLGKNLQNSKAYLLGTARIMVADYYRNKKKLQKVVQLKSKHTDNIYDKKQNITSDAKEIAEEMRKIISKCPPKAQEAAELILLNNLSYEEAAKIANCSKRIFYKRYYKSLKILKNKCEDNSL